MNLIKTCKNAHQFAHQFSMNLNNFMSENTFFDIIQDCEQRKRHCFPSPPIFPLQPLLFHECINKSVTLFLPVFSSLVCFLSLVRSKHLVIYHSKIFTTCEECALLSWRTLVEVTENTETIGICVCIL